MKGDADGECGAMGEIARIRYIQTRLAAGGQLKEWANWRPIADQLRLLRRALLALRRRQVLRQECSEHPMAWSGITDRQKFAQLLWERGNINPILAAEHLRALMAEPGWGVTSWSPKGESFVCCWTENQHWRAFK